MNRTRVAVILGGRSSEHSISCISGRSIVEALDPARYEITVIGIGHDGSWVTADSLDDLLVSDGPLPEVSAGAAGVSIEAALDADVVFPVLHGPWGEDGSLQGVLETLQVPYVGSGIASSSVTMDKGLMKTFLQAAGLPVGQWRMVTSREWDDDPDGVLASLEGLGFPVFVKPARAGSSLGISKVDTAVDLRAAIEEARTHDPRVIVEAAVLHAREIECAVLSDAHGQAQASRCAEIVVRAGHDFYDFEAKYLDDSAELIVPAHLPADVEAEVQRLAVQAFEALGCEGLARVDFFLRNSIESDGAGDPTLVVNEVNTMPGFTTISMFPRMWLASGLDYPSLIDALVQDALRRGTGLR